MGFLHRSRADRYSYHDSCGYTGAYRRVNSATSIILCAFPGRCSESTGREERELVLSERVLVGRCECSVSGKEGAEAGG